MDDMFVTIKKEKNANEIINNVLEIVFTKEQHNNKLSFGDVVINGRLKFIKKQPTEINASRQLFFKKCISNKPIAAQSSQCPKRISLFF